jgi:hypothetical protein
MDIEDRDDRVFECNLEMADTIMFALKSLAIMQHNAGNRDGGKETERLHDHFAARFGYQKLDLR